MITMDEDLHPAARGATPHRVAKAQLAAMDLFTLSPGEAIATDGQPDDVIDVIGKKNLGGGMAEVWMLVVLGMAAESPLSDWAYEKAMRVLVADRSAVYDDIRTLDEIYPGQGEFMCFAVITTTGSTRERVTYATAVAEELAGHIGRIDTIVRAEIDRLGTVYSGTRS